MKILPLKTEVSAVVSVLRDESYEDETAMAKDIVRAVYNELAKRDSYCVALRAPQGIEAFWPFLYEAEAKRFNDQYPGLPTERRYVLRMRSSVVDLATQERRTQEAKTAGQHIAWVDKHREASASSADREQT